MAVAATTASGRSESVVTQVRSKAPTEHDIDVGRRLRGLRTLRGISQTALGDQIGVTFQQIQKYEKGANRISVGRLAKIADALRVEIGYLIGASATTSSPPAPSMSKEAGKLVRTFLMIEDAAVRKQILRLVEALASSTSA